MVKTNGKTADPGFDAPEFDRLNYFYGQMLCASDFLAEQCYFREKIKLHNRCLHGYGTACGLRVCVYVPKSPEPGCTPEVPAPWIAIEPGLALDSEGNELIVRKSRLVNLWDRLSADDQATVSKEVGDDKTKHYSKPLYVYLHHVEDPLCPSTPVVPNSCGGALPNQFKKLRDCVSVSVSLTKPAEDERCETCCCEGPCACDGLLLARIDRFRPDHHVHQDHVHNEVRRRLGIYPLTTITGVNWPHGAELSRENVRHLLHHGLVVQFSRPVLVETLKRGVVDIYQIESKSTRHANIIELSGKFETCHDATTCELRYHIPHLEECPEPGDRVLIVVRSGFILDGCCQPVDGLNVGGRVPYVACEPHYPEELGHIDPCKHFADPPWGYPPWSSGNGTGGGTFESWFYVRDKHDHPKKVGGAE